jgi:type IV pilus assembly protein PilW
VLGLEQDDAAGTGAFNLTSDAISVLRADVSREYVVASHNNAGSFTFDTTTGLTAGDFLVATNCNHVSVFQTATVSSGAVTYSTGTSPGNSAVDLGVTYAPNSRAYRLVASTYYVDTNPAGQPALFRSRPAGASATPTAEELIEGVEDIQISYGVDTDATADRLPNFTRASDAVDPYLTADEVNSALVPGATAADKWSRVISVKISLLMRTVDDNVIPDSQTYTFNGADVTATDRRLRKVFTHVVRLRNR